MSDLVQPTADQQESLLAHLREGFLIWSALQIVGVSREQVELLGQPFAEQLQVAFETGTANLDSQATKMALAGISSPLMQFLLRSRNRRYNSDQPAVALNLGIEPPTQPERPTIGARERLAAQLDAIAERLTMGQPELLCRAERAAGPPEADDPDPPYPAAEPPVAPPSGPPAGADAAQAPIRSFVEEEVARVGFWWPEKGA